MAVDFNALYGKAAGEDGGGGLGGLLQKPGIKQAGAGMFATWLMNKILSGVHEGGMRKIQREGLRSQAEMVTPENLYFQAAQPQAREEESMAHQALMTHSIFYS